MCSSGLHIDNKDISLAVMMLHIRFYPYTRLDLTMVEIYNMTSNARVE